jgi:hypothetical protein
MEELKMQRFERAMTNKRKIKYAAFDDSFPRIAPIKQIVPQWYKDSPMYTEGKSPRFLPTTNTTMKACVPFLDTLTTGYYIPLQSDILVEYIDNQINLTWGYGNPVNIRETSSASTLPIPHGCHDTHFTWSLPSIIQLPKNYSAIFTHPLNRFDLPFVTLSGIVDGDFIMGAGSYPFFIKENFEGIIPRGTPIAQFIPFKTEEWISEEDTSLIEKELAESNRSRSKISGWYKHNGWVRKSYK